MEQSEGGRQQGNEINRLSYRNLTNSNHPSCAGDQVVFVFVGVMSPESLIACFPWEAQV